MGFREAHLERGLVWDVGGFFFFFFFPLFLFVVDACPCLFSPPPSSEFSGAIGTLLFYFFYEGMFYLYPSATVCWTVSYAVSIAWQHSLHRFLVFGSDDGVPYLTSLMKTYVVYARFPGAGSGCDAAYRAVIVSALSCPFVSSLQTEREPGVSPQSDMCPRSCC